MSVNPLRQRHSPGVTDDFLYHRDRYFLFSKHGNAGVASIVRLVGAPDKLHDRHPIGIIVVPIVKVSALWRVQQILTAVVIPLSEKWVGLVRYGNYAYSVFSLALNDIEVMLINMDVLTFEVKQFRYTNSAVYQHKYDLDVEIVPLHPECLDFLITERTAVGSVRISVFVFEAEYRTV